LSLRNAIVSASVLLVLGLGTVFVLSTQVRTVFLPGTTSEGHHLFEASCTSCHEGFKPVSNATCTRCHEAELVADQHGAKKFRDPRWAGLMSRLDVLTCTTCHHEHVSMFGRGVHLEPDLCMACHEGIIQGNLQSHTGFAPNGCWTGGCHNFHDHRSISTGFLYKNLDQPPILPVPITLELGPSGQGVPPSPDLNREFLGGAL